MKRMSSIAMILAIALACGGCGKSGSSDEEGSSGSGSEKKSKVQELKNLGIKGKVPANASVRKAPIGDGVMVQGGGFVVTVEEAKPSRPKTVEAAKKDADTYTPKNIKSEKLSDGWVLTFQNKGSMGKNFFVQVRRSIGGKDYWCSTMQSNPSQAKGALAFCKSLQK